MEGAFPLGIFVLIGAGLAVFAPWLLGLRPPGLVAILGMVAVGFAFFPQGMPVLEIDSGEGRTGPALSAAFAAAVTTAVPIPPTGWLTGLGALVAMVAGVVADRRFSVQRVGLYLLLGAHPWLPQHPVALFFSRWGCAAAVLILAAWAVRRNWRAVAERPEVALAVSGTAALIHALAWPYGWGAVADAGPLVFCLFAYSLCFWFGLLPRLFLEQTRSFSATTERAARLAMGCAPRIAQFWIVSFGVWLAFYAGTAWGVNLRPEWRGWSFVRGPLSVTLSLYLAALWYLPRSAAPENETPHDASPQ